MSRVTQNGLFISLEGPEGAGKSTQSAMLSRALQHRGLEVLETREPGGTVLGEELRRLLKHFGEPGEVSPEAELLMFGASRAQLVRQVIRPHLCKGGVVICDRFADSTTVYQGIARGLDVQFISQMHRFSVGDCWPGLTFVLDLPVSVGFQRTHLRNAGADPNDRIEAESRTFHEAVRNGFIKLAEQEPQRIHVVDASADIDAIHSKIMEVVDHAIG